VINMSIRYIFNTSGQYSAFIHEDDLFSIDCDWLGVIRNGNEVFNTEGYFIGQVLDDDRIARATNQNRQNIPRPVRPLRPIRPLRPLRRLRMMKLPYPYKDIFEKKSPKVTFNDSFKSEKDFSNLIGAKIVAGDNTFLGYISFDPLDPNSISNQYGDYGGVYSVKSIFNPYGVYGSIYSQFSPLNPYSSTPPKIIKNNRMIGFLSSNPYQMTRIDAQEFFDWFNKSSRN